MKMDSLQLEETINSSDVEVKCILSTILNMNMWNERNEKVIISSINKLLLSSMTRLQGLEYLNLIIGNCSTKTISENGLQWISSCLTKSPNDDLKEVKLATIEKIVDNCFEEQEFKKKFVSEYIAKVFEICLSTHSSYHEYEAGLSVLAICMKYYGSWFTPHKSRIENYLTNFLENQSEEVVENAAVAFHYVQQTGGAGIDGFKHKMNFSTSFDKLCVTVQKLFDKFFENEIEIDKNDRSTQEAFEFTDLPHYTGKMLHITARRIKNCLMFIITMLLKGFPAEKEIKPGDVLDLINRGTAIHHCLITGKDNSLENFQFSILLNEVQIELLRLLHVLIIWLQGNALPFNFTITKILVDSLTKSQLCQCFKTESLYQEMVYKVLGCWIRISRGAIHSHFQTQLVKCILKDITPIKNSVSLSLSSEIGKNKSKKAIQKSVEERIISSRLGNASNGGLTNVQKLNIENNCLFALDTLKHLLFGTILKLKPNILQELYIIIISTLIDIQTSYTKHPYTNEECVAKLYEVLVAFYEQDTLKTLPPLQLSIDIFNRGINGINRTIALTCEQGLSNLEKICQPVCPSMFISAGTSSTESHEESAPLDEATNEFNGAVSPNNEVHLNLEALTVSNNEEAELYGGDIETGIHKDITEDIIKDPSIHIIDVQILQTSATSVQSVNTLVSDESVINLVEEAQEQQNGAQEMSDGTEDVEPPSKKIRVEEDSRSEEACVTGKPNNKEDARQFDEENNEIAVEQTGAEEQPGDILNLKVEAPSHLKVEAPSQEMEDDIFVEGDDFVDEVKDY